MARLTLLPDRVFDSHNGSMLDDEGIELTAAELLGWEDRVGSLHEGAFADLVLVAGDPLDDISTLRSPNGVMKDGRWVKAP